MNKLIKLNQDKITKNTVRYTDGDTIQIYLPKQEIIVREGAGMGSYPQALWLKLSTEEIKP